LNSTTISAILFGCVFGSAVLGMVLGRLLPPHHLDEGTKDLVKLGTGIIATLSALLLGLLVASAKGTFDAMSVEITQSGANITTLDRLLIQYGPEADDARRLLRQNLKAVVDRLVAQRESGARDPVVPRTDDGLGGIQAVLRGLSPRTDGQRWILTRVQEICVELSRARWLMLERMKTDLPVPFILVLASWLAIIFAGLGLFAPRNATVVVVLFLCALSVSSAIFLIFELNHPIGGAIRVTIEPLRSALMGIGG
jgi:hypothetical protein